MYPVLMEMQMRNNMQLYPGYKQQRFEWIRILIELMNYLISHQVFILSNSQGSVFFLFLWKTFSSVLGKQRSLRDLSKVFREFSGTRLISLTWSNKREGKIGAIVRYRTEPPRENFQKLNKIQKSKNKK